MKIRITDRSRLGVFCLSAILLCAANLAISPEALAKPRKDTAPQKGQGKGLLKKIRENTNSPPSISGTPTGTVLENSFFDFVPDASDPDGDSLSFTIANKPAWADFDPTTGALYGTPTASDVGQYSSITIAASDSKATAELPAFAIEVTSTGVAAVTLNWQAPTQNTDGTPLTDLAGYRIYYGVNSANLGNVIEVSNPGITTYVVDGLTPDIWYFASTALNSQGMESDLSAQAIRDTR